MKLIGGLVVLCSIYIVDAADLIVSLPYGTIRGKELVSPGNKTFRAFQGIPYAAAPVGTLRFQAPQDPYSWEGTKNTTKDGHVCFSIKKDSDEENEDCLFMNVFTPILNNSLAEKLPVMLWIYGGAFRTGSSKYNSFGPDFLIEKDVVIASFNYRVGPFGFLATEDGVIPGNAGLKDQAMAIKWVNENIALFGGDPARVTLFGQSAGGASVGYQLLYKKNEGLINGAILQSGSPLSSFSFMGDISARAYAFDLASQIDNSTNFGNDTDLLVDFLLNVTGRQIDKASTLTTVTSRPLPVIENDSEDAFLTRESYEMLLAGDFLKIPIMVGTTSEEDIYGFDDIESVNSSFTSYDKKHAKFVPSKGFHLKTGQTSEEVGEEIYQLYFANVSSDEKLGHFVKYSSDNKYSKPMIKHADLSSNYTDVYFYIFSHDGPMGNWNFSVPGADLVGHGEDDRYIWQVKSSTYTNVDLSIFPEADRLTHERVITLWTNFAKYLNPTPEESALLQNITWPKVTPGNFQYLDIGDDLIIREDPKSPYYAGWTKIYEQYNERPFTIF
ncbi:juvenile hormone esterase-like [Anthonomus grandis grandis]|uniref:juvenile hormone esterase-like n=1 Tax=Anthonomus grandis grandis TaxID=2921223 RepID=UPI002165C3DD|nr:juvenile hormone esterase-like [Anthonomus grandis grandis]